MDINKSNINGEGSINGIKFLTFSDGELHLKDVSDKAFLVLSEDRWSFIISDQIISRGTQTKSKDNNAISFCSSSDVPQLKLLIMLHMALKDPEMFKLLELNVAKVMSIMSKEIKKLREKIIDEESKIKS